MSSGLYSGTSGLALGAGLSKGAQGLYSGASGLAGGSGLPWTVGLTSTPPYVPNWTRPLTLAAGIANGTIPADAIDFTPYNTGNPNTDFYTWITACNTANKPGALGVDLTITTAAASLVRTYLYRGIYGYGAANPKIIWTGRALSSASQRGLFFTYLEDVTIRGIEFEDWSCVLAVGQKTLPLIGTDTITGSMSGTATLTITNCTTAVSPGMLIYQPGTIPYETTVISGTVSSGGSGSVQVSASLTASLGTINIVDPAPYHTANQPLTYIADPTAGVGFGLYCPRLGRIVTTGSFNISQISIKRQIEGTTAMGNDNGGASNNYYFSDAAWTAVLETVDLFTGASATTNADIVTAINANTATHGYEAQLALDGSVLVTPELDVNGNVVVPVIGGWSAVAKPFVEMVITQTGTLATYDVKTPGVSITHCTFTDCNIAYGALLDVAELGPVEFHKNSCPGTWSGVYAQVTRWGHFRAANNEWYDCLLSRGGQVGRPATGAMCPSGSSLTEFNTFFYMGTDSAVHMRYHLNGTTYFVENNYAHDVSSANNTNTVNCAVFADVRNCWQRTNNNRICRIGYNQIVSVKGTTTAGTAPGGAEDANAMYSKPRGLTIAANYIEDTGSAFRSTGTLNGSETSGIIIKNPGPWNRPYTSTYGTNEVSENMNILGNSLVNMPPGIPQMKADEVFGFLRIEDTLIKNWVNYRGVAQITGDIDASGMLTIASVITGTLALGVTLRGPGIAAGVTVSALQGGTLGEVGSTYTTTAASATVGTVTIGMGIEGTSGSTSGPMRITGVQNNMSIKRNRFEQCDPGTTDPTLMTNFHNLTSISSVTVPNFTAANFNINNLEIANNGATHPNGTYPVYGVNTALIRYNFNSNNPAAGFAATVPTGFNRILTAGGADSGFRMLGTHTNRSETSIGTDGIGSQPYGSVNYLAGYGVGV